MRNKKQEKGVFQNKAKSEVIEQNRDSPSKKIAIIRIRGEVGLRKPIKDTLTMLKLFKKNYCVVVDAIPSLIGMIKKVKDYVTWGEIDSSTLMLLKEKREETTKDKNGKEVKKNIFRLNPQRGGFERKGIKMPFNSGGALGDRKERINELIRRMV